MANTPPWPAAPGQGVDVVARLHARRKVDFRKARRLAKNDGLFVWTKGYQQSEILSASRVEPFAGADYGAHYSLHRHHPRLSRRRITLVTTLLDPKDYPAQELIALYARRWRLELCLRDLKTTMGMEQLRCKSPDMAEKELLAYLVAHNLIRCLIAEAVARYQVDLERVSFKGSVDALRQYSDAIARPATKRCAANSGRTCCSTSRATWSAIGPTAKNLARSSAARKTSAGSPSLAANSESAPSQPLLEITSPQFSSA